MIETLIDQIRDTGAHLFSLTAIENGEAQTFTFNPANPCNDTYSVSKAYTMTAIGLCYDRGLVKPAAKITDLFADSIPTDIDPTWHKVTVDDVLRHRMGIEKGFLDIDVEDINDYPTRDFLSIIFNTKLTVEPGEHYCYSDAAYYLLSRVVTRVSGEAMDDMLMRDIFLPTGCREAAWSKCPQGYAMGATGLYTRSIDIARLGQIYAHGGMWGDRRILSEEWVKLAMERSYSLNLRSNGAYTKGGMRGQMFYFNPETGRSVGWLAFEREKRSDLIVKLLIENNY